MWKRRTLRRLERRLQGYEATQFISVMIESELVLLLDDAVTQLHLLDAGRLIEGCPIQLAIRQGGYLTIHADGSATFPGGERKERT